MNAPPRVGQVEADEILAFLGACRPLDALAPEQLGEVARRAVVELYRPGEEIVDAFATPGTQPCVVWRGRVDIWSHADRLRERPDQRAVRGGLFGYLTALTGEAVGPRAVAASDVVVVRVAADLVAPAFATRSGAHFLAQEMTGTGQRVADPPSYTLVEDLVRTAPLIIPPTATIADAAARMDEVGFGYAAVQLPENRYGLITDAGIRHAVATAVPPTTPVSEVMVVDPATVTVGVSADEALIKVLDTDRGIVLVTDRSGALHGAVAPPDFVVSSATAGASLHEQIHRAVTPDELRSRFEQVPATLLDLLTQGLSPSRVIAVYSTIVDTVIRRSITQVFGRYSQLDPDAFTWLSLGSNGRREAVPSSDIDAAVAFDNDLEPDERLGYTPALEEVAEVLLRVGLSIDGHGVSPTNPEFVRSHASWRSAARSWLSDATQDRAVIMTCLLLDGRAILGDPGLPEVVKVFTDLRRHPETMRLLLRASITTPKSVHRPSAMVPKRRRFQFKSHVLTPIANIARWAALSVGSTALPTRERLLAGSGTELLSESDASVLIDVFEVVQGLRLRRQLDQLAAGLPPADSVRLPDLSTIDRRLVMEAVGEIRVIQRRMRNLATVVLPEMTAGAAPGTRSSSRSPVP